MISRLFRRSFAGTVLLATALMLTGLAVAASRPAPASAHPLGNFTINRYARLDLFRGGVQVHYALDLAEIPTFQAMSNIDADHDGVASPVELARYADTIANGVIAGLDARVDGQRLDLRVTSAEAVLAPGGTGLEVLRVDLVLSAPVEQSADVRAVVVIDRNYEDRVGWKEIVVRPTEGARASLGTLDRDRSDGLRSYPVDALASAPDMRRADFTWATATGAAAPTEVARRDVTIATRAGGFEDLVRRPQSPLVIAAAFLAAFGFGALHALGPGHGKAMVAAYLVGSKGTVRDAIALGMTVTVTHVSMVYLLGFVTIAASAFLVPERVYFVLSLASGASVVAMGLGLFVSRARRLRAHAIPEATEHRHGLFGATHSHAPAAAAEVAEAHHQVHEHAHVEGAEAHAHDHPHAHDHALPQTRTEDGVSRRSLLTLGVLGGLLPCPSALIVMLAAISLGQVVWGMALIVAFSLGLAFVLTAIGVALVLGARLQHLVPGALRGGSGRLGRLARALPAASALGIAAAGALIVYQAMGQFMA